jgi:uncharacterized membrane protein
MRGELKKYASSFIIKEDSISKILLRYIQHNPYHYIKIKVRGEKVQPCARCFGHWIGLILGFIFTSPFWLRIVYVPTQYFYLIFTIAWIFAIPTILDWGTVKLKLREGNNKIRVVAGFLHGLGAIIYFFVLPADIVFKIVTYSLYSGGFMAMRRLYNLQHYKVKKGDKK